MTTRVPTGGRETEAKQDRSFLERERNRFAARALSYLILLNGAAALVLLAVCAYAPEATIEPKLAAAMMFFSGGAMAALLSSFLAYVDRTMRIESPGRDSLRRALRFLAIVAVIGSGAAFLTGMNMVGATSAQRSSSHPKGPKAGTPKAGPSERVDFLNEVKSL